MPLRFIKTGIWGFNTQPPEGGCRAIQGERRKHCSFNTQPPEGGCPHLRQSLYDERWFQHTAARKRLLLSRLLRRLILCSFQHTAARKRLPKNWPKCLAPRAFQHTAARKRLQMADWSRNYQPMFQHTAARKRLRLILVRRPG